MPGRRRMLALLGSLPHTTTCSGPASHGRFASLWTRSCREGSPCRAGVRRPAQLPPRGLFQIRRTH
eukprot:7727673-Lingulodinium_polyedra.AAC.1